MNSSQLIFYISLVILSKANIALQENETGEIIVVNVLHRHGERTPAEFYPNDPYKNKSYWPEGIGQLTNVGKREEFELGQWLRRRYDALLAERYGPGILYIQYTERDKTQRVECLAGMFSLKGTREWSDDLDWQPSVQTTHKSLNNVLSQPLGTPCPAYDQELQRVFTSDEKIRQLNQTYFELLRWTNENSGKHYSLLTLNYVYEVLLMENSKNLTLPDWTKRVFPEPMKDATIYNYRLKTWTPKLARLNTGLLLKDMIQNMLNKVQNQTTKNIYIYSGDDETIVNLLNALGVFNNILPPHAACVVMELRVDSSGSHYVSLYYRNSTTESPYPLTLEGCDPLCPVDTFLNITSPLIPDNWEQECTIGKELDWIVLFGVGALISVILVEPALYCYYFRRRS